MKLDEAEEEVGGGGDGIFTGDRQTQSVKITTRGSLSWSKDEDMAGKKDSSEMCIK